MNISLSNLINDAKTHFNEGNYKSSIIICNDILKIDPNNLEGLYITSNIFLQLRKFELAIKILNKLISLSKKNTVFYYNLAIAYEGINSLKEAENNYLLSIKYDDPISIIDISDINSSKRTSVLSLLNSLISFLIYFFKNNL